MKALEKGIVGRWLANTPVTVVGPWMGRAADNTPYPYTVFSYPGGGQTVQFHGSQEDEIVVRFTAYGDESTVSVIQEALHARFDNCKLDLSAYGGGQTYHFVRSNRDARYEGVDKNGVEVYRADSTYRTKTSL